MRPGTLTGLATAAILAVGLIPAAAAADDEAGTPPARATGPTPPGSTGNTHAADRALTAVEAAFEGRGGGAGSHEHGTPTSADGASTDVTMLLLELRRRLDGLSAGERRTAERYFARPTDGNEDFGANYGARARPTSDCAQAPRRSPRFCVHWARRTADAPPSGDRDRDGIPDQVETTRAVVSQVWRRTVTRGGYRAPLRDGSRGGNGKLDVYLADIGDAGVFGYCATERKVSGNARYGYCVLDDDYSRDQFGTNTPLANLKVTAAHEFFHAVQFAYDAFDDPWFMESTATWIEDEIYDGVNDNRYYLANSPLSFPARPLDLDRRSLHVYGSWIWWRYLTERFPGARKTGLPVLVRTVWRAADSADTTRPNLYSLRALEKVLTARGQQISQLYGSFSTANRRPGAFYEEGSAYPTAPVSLGPYDMTSEQRTVRAVPTLSHLSSETAAFRPQGAATTRLRIDVDVPDAVHEPVVRAVVVRTNGTARVTRLSLSSNGVGATSVPFDVDTVQQVELVLTNGGHAFSCWQYSDWSCSGRPKDDNLDFGFSATRLTS